jgi:hypothetical protein
MRIVAVFRLVRRKPLLSRLHAVGYGQRQGPRGWKATASRSGESQQNGSQHHPIASANNQNPFDHDDELAFTHHPRRGIGPS